MARPLGAQNKDKPFAAALRMELALLGEDDPKALRGIARNLITIAAGVDNPMAAIKEIADRLDGKPAQESTVTVNRNVNELTDDEIAARIAELRGTGASDHDGETPIDPAQLN